MNKEINWIEHRGRAYLKDVLPLDTPFKIELEPTSACNFKCIYCRHSTVKIKPQFMSMEIFDRIILGLKKFPNKIKTLHFVGIGEPLLNKNIYEMITKAKEVADDVALITNGSLLTKENSNKLIETGINTIRVSLQGINEEDYLKTAGYKINFNEFIDNLEYLYKNKSNITKLYLKMPDIVINTDIKKKIFYELFEDKCDYLIIQNIAKLFSDVDYSNIIVNETKNNFRICPQLFYMLCIAVSGSVYPCCAGYHKNNLKVGDINDSLVDIFSGGGQHSKNIRLIHLKGMKDTIDACKKCEIPNYYYNKYDDIDDYADELLKKYE